MRSKWPVNKEHGSGSWLAIQDLGRTIFWNRDCVIRNRVTTTLEFANRQSRHLLRNLTAGIRRTLQSADAETVHNLRVSIRRFMETLLVFQPCLPVKEANKARRRLKRIMTQAGEVRNCDIAATLLVTRFTNLRENIQNQREDARRVLVIALRNWIDRDYSSKLRDSLTAESGARDRDFCRSGIRITASGMLRHMTKSLFRLGDKAAERASPRALHRFRITAKQYRYTLELFMSVSEREAGARLNQIKDVQSRLGNINDCETARIMAAGWGCGGDVDKFLKKREQKQMKEFGREWKRGFNDSMNRRNWLSDLGCLQRDQVIRVQK
jgi:CHAD domain-containing protein